MAIIRFGIIIFFAVISLVFSNCGNYVPQSNKIDSLYPTATKFSTTLYASEIQNKPANIKILAGHMEVDSSAELSWVKEIPEQGDYDVIVSYSIPHQFMGLMLTAGNSFVTDTLPVTRGVFEENKEWYNINCERRLLKTPLHLQKGSNNLKLNLYPVGERMKMVFYTIELVPLEKKKDAAEDILRAVASRPGMDWFSSMKYGVMLHWTAQSAPRSGPHAPYKQAVAEFNVNRFVEIVDSTGADYVIFTANHADPHFPAPLAKWEKEYPGQTTERDLIMEIATALKQKNISLIIYLATHVYAKQDKVDSEEFDRLNTELISEIGNHYKDNIVGFWLDGFYQSFQNHPSFNFEKFYNTSKTGNPSRLLALNSWLYPVVTQWQDYWAGEVYTPSTLPDARIIKSGPGKGLQFQSLIVLENDWVHEKINTKIPSPRLKTDQVINYISSCNGKGPVTINLGIYQDGTIGEEAMAEMQKIKTVIDK